MKKSENKAYPTTLTQTNEIKIKKEILGLTTDAKPSRFIWQNL